MNAFTSQRHLTLTVLIGAFFLSSLTGCAQLSNTKAETNKSKTAENVIPQWIVHPPKLKGSYDKVVTLRIVGTVADAKAMAVSQASAKVKQLVDADIKAHYVKTQSEIEQSYGEFERKIRSRIRDQLNAMEYAKPTLKAVYENKATDEISVWVQVTKKALATSLSDELLATDERLRDFIHVSERGSDFSQLLSVLPALPTLEKRQELRDALVTFLNKPIQLNSDELARLLNTYITRKFDELMVNLQSTTADSKPFETYLQQSLIQQGVPVSVRKPDLTIKYFLEFDSDGMNQGEQKVSLVADAEVVNDLGATFASVSKEYSGQNKSMSDARKQAMNGFTADISKVIIDATLRYIDKVNKSQVSKS